jgi:hypothetical protein
MSNVIQLSAYRRPAPSVKSQRKGEIVMAIEMLQQRRHFSSAVHAMRGSGLRFSTWLDVRCGHD